MFRCLRIGLYILIDTMQATTTLIQKILVRLPVVSLLRFKSVCKSWCALIESSFFIDLHTTTTFNSSSSSSNKFGSFILLAGVNKYLFSTITYQRSSITEHGLFMLSSESGSGGWRWRRSTGSNDDQDDQQQQQLVFKLDSLRGFPPCYKVCELYNPIDIVGSCNGLLCLYDGYANVVSLWNPATRQFRILPKSITINDDCPRHLVAFGFDVETKDYKVLLLSGFRPMYYRQRAPIECICRVQVYSLSTDSWRLLEGMISLPGDPFLYTNEILYLNGSCFFMANFFCNKQQLCFPENDRFLISFDFTKEIFTPIRLPDHHRDQKLYLSYLGDKIALFTTTCDQPPLDIFCTYGYNDYNIWVLNEHSSSSVNKESWTKLHSFRIEPIRSGEWNLPRGISNDGEFALIETKYSSEVGKKMKLYNLVTKEVKRNFLSCGFVRSNAIAYKPSLVSIIGGNGAAADIG